MSEESPKSGLVVSCVLHAGLLALVIVGFASAPKFEDASEATPVDTITKAQFEQMMGERTAQAPPAAQPAPATPEPPQPPQPPPELRQAEETPPVPPTPPTPPKPEPPKPEPPQPPEKPVPPPPKPASIPPSPPPRPEPPKPDALEKPQPPVKPKIVDAQPPERPRETPPPPKPVERPKPVEKPKPDQLAKLLAEATTRDPAKDPAKSLAKPFDPKAIAKLIGDGKPSTSQTNPGAPTARAQRMSGSQERQLDDWFKEAYMACWSPPPTTPEGDVYIPQVQVTFNADGTLSGQPVLVNPPPDPAWRAHAESAVRAALRCNPMKIPSQYSPFFEQWRTKTIHFDPREAQG